MTHHSQLEWTLQIYYSEWQFDVLYHIREIKHPLEATRWKSAVNIRFWNPTLETWQLESIFEHKACRTTMRDSMGDAAF